MNEQEQGLFATFVLSIIRDNGGRFFIPADKVAKGDFTMRWDNTPLGLTVTETTPVAPVGKVAARRLGLAPVKVRKKAKVKK